MASSESGLKIVVTGATGGFGTEIIKALLKSKPHQIVGTSRKTSGKEIEALQAFAASEAVAGSSLRFVNLDYSSTESVNQGIAQATELLGGSIDIVINNAGYGVSGILESATPEEYLQNLNVNVIGPHRVSRAVLPGFRKNQSGTIINISSVIGRQIIPFIGVYQSTKFALEAQSEALRLEVSQFGVQVLVVEPGAFATEFHANAIEGSDQSVIDAYGPLSELKKASSAKFQEALVSSGRGDPKILGQAVVDLINTPVHERPFRTVVDPFTGGEDAKAINELAEVTLKQTLEHFHQAHLLNVVRK